ncbi:trans-aconitate 2-methyltransferase [Pseudonocardiaceae bacterium YIM PH 21723]|nr:trans-aconitate 2-methyltransferase [Pseudonocardiaceae bacterium YIM PH 21723]
MWDPTTYLDFADHRARPFHDLLARVGAVDPRRVVDAGCGPGNVTGLLAERWPKAELEAFDSSPEMVAQARERGLNARVLDIREWQPAADTDVVISNAVLQWIPEHEELLPGWVAALPPEAWFALQVPGNHGDRTHQIIGELAATQRWSGLLDGFRPERGVPAAARYGDILAVAGMATDVWETTYVHRLTGEDPVLHWVSGTALRPIRAKLDDEQWARFTAELAPRYREEYPVRSDGTTWLPFRRVFAVGRKV